MKLKMYTDGSFDKEKQEVSGGIIILNNKEKPLYARQFITKKPNFIEFWNISGELLAVMLGLGKLQSLLIEQQCEITIYYDYVGIERWVANNNRWKAKTLISKMYVKFMENFRDSNPWLALRFAKVKAHAGDKWNECVDRLSRGIIPLEIKEITEPPLVV